ncbi:MAG: hypothetical protein IJ411_02815 [Oscillospiraceae bacterium]|nr:hypothetical protein [Oscillospiraceae bacterium]
MIDKTKKYWSGDCAADIDDYLRAYTELPELDVRPVTCSCGSDAFTILVDQEEGAVLLKCTHCAEEQFLLDSAEYWPSCQPKAGICRLCKGGEYNVRVGLVRREDGSIQWVYVGNRCTKCGALGSYVDWGIDYESSDEMEELLQPR